MALDKGAQLVHEAVVPDFCKLGVLKIPGDLYLAIVEYFKRQSWQEDISA
jgi:hypothetical protein